jgi:hypothetical protein
MVSGDRSFPVVADAESGAEDALEKSHFRIRRLIAKMISSRPGATASLAMHICILAAIMPWTHMAHERNGKKPFAIPVELVTIADRTNIAPMVEEDENFPEKAQEIPAPPTPPKIVELAPALDAKLLPVPKPLTTQPKREIADIANDTTSLEEHQSPSSGPKSARIGDQDIKGAGAQTTMTMNLPDALRNQIARCWRPPPGPPDPGQTATFKLVLNPDGSVARPPQVSDTTATGDPTKSVEAEAVRRAIYTCAPYSLPVRRYKEWRVTTLVFNPRLAAGRAALHGNKP